MIILLDTCDFLWFIAGSDKLPANWRSDLQDPANKVFLSVVSLWEMLVKEAIGKLKFPKPAVEYVPEQCAAHGIVSLELDEPAVRLLTSLPAIHRDPIDRMLVCQALSRGMRFASSDSVVAQYAVDLL